MNAELNRPSALISKPRCDDMFWLDKNENLDPILLEISQKILQKIPSRSLATYPDSGDLYRKLARWVEVSPESLLLTHGSDGAIRIVFESFVEHMEKVVHTNPTFAMYPVYCKMFGAQTIEMHYKSTSDGPQLSVEMMLKTVVEKSPKLFCLPNPDSPTGTILSKEEIGAILKVCELKGTVLLVDEAYYPFYDKTVVPWTSNSKNLIVARTFSKAWGSAGLRIGYTVSHPKTSEYLHKMRPMYETSTLSNEFIYNILDHVKDMEKVVSRINKTKLFFQKELERMNFKVLPTNGNFLHVDFLGKRSLIYGALDKKVLYRKGFDQSCLKGYSRFTIGTESEMEYIVDIIQKALKNK